jgi:hypothetical protein
MNKENLMLVGRRIKPKESIKAPPTPVLPRVIGKSGDLSGVGTKDGYLIIAPGNAEQAITELETVPGKTFNGNWG